MSINFLPNSPCKIAQKKWKKKRKKFFVIFFLLLLLLSFLVFFFFCVFFFVKKSEKQRDEEMESERLMASLSHSLFFFSVRKINKRDSDWMKSYEKTLNELRRNCFFNKKKSLSKDSFFFLPLFNRKKFWRFVLSMTIFSSLFLCCLSLPSSLPISCFSDDFVTIKIYTLFCLISFAIEFTESIFDISRELLRIQICLIICLCL